MRKKWGCLIIMVLVISFFFALSPLAQEKKEGEEIYTIKQGDTLWDISSKFLKDPFLWPKLWQRNPYITNPHWIYPGQPIRLAPAEELRKEMLKEAGKEPEVKKEEVPPEEKKPEIAEEKPAEVKPAEVKPSEVKPPEVKPTEEIPAVFPEVRTAGFVSDVKLRGIGIILDSREGKNLMSEGDIIYLAFKTSAPIMVGNKYTAIRGREFVRHPVTNQKIGIKYIITGVIQVIDLQGNFYTGKVVEAFDAIEKGDILRPYLKDK
jgi:LysM repeat protein